jgi:hypothetical protein
MFLGSASREQAGTTGCCLWAHIARVPQHVVPEGWEFVEKKPHQKTAARMSRYSRITPSFPF